MQTTLEGLHTRPNVDIAIVPPQHLDLVLVSLPVPQIGLLRCPQGLSEAFFPQVLSEHVIQKSSVVCRVEQNPGVRVGRDDRVQRFTETLRPGVLGDLDGRK
jgi:hypothetical protein